MQTSIHVVKATISDMHGLEVTSSTDAGGHSICSPVIRQQGTVRDPPAPQDGCKGGIYDVAEEMH
jgi:hypothetical protein